MAGFNPRTSGAFRRVGWAPWLSEDRELPYLYENTSTNRVAVFRENMYDSMGRRRRHWCVWDGDNRSRLAAVRADKRARRVDFLAGIQTSLIAEAATVDGVENRGSSWRRSALGDGDFWTPSPSPSLLPEGSTARFLLFVPLCGLAGPGRLLPLWGSAALGGLPPVPPLPPFFFGIAAPREWLRVRGQNVNRCACLCDRGAARVKL